MSTAQLSPGTVVDARFTIGAATWARAGAQSYAATDERGQPVVVTAYAAACFSSGLVLERSLRELRQLQSLQSPRVVAVLACGKLPDGGIFEVNGAFPGARLDAVVADGPMGGPEAASVIEQVGEGLLEAQKAGVIHRNLGPRVVFVGPEGAAVTGFSVGEPHGDKSFGPLDTIAPEQVEGKVVDQRTLIYNLAALMHLLITGTALFDGDPATQLAAHLRTEAPDHVHARLRRALGKDPRMRPMMLKQFLSELRAIGGGVARVPVTPSTASGKAPPLPGGDLSVGSKAPPSPDASKPAGAPSSRGWTMFMQGEGEAAPAAAAAPAAGPGSDVPSKPKTRGWTMFMEGAEEEAPKNEVKDEPVAKPSTRGWTMFMEDEEGQAPPPADAASPVALEAAPAPAAAATAEGAQPKTRGWTMFMEDDEAAAPATAQAATPAAAPATVVAPAPAPAPAVGGAGAPKPSTRGWTMFMTAEEEAAAGAVAQPAEGTVVGPPPAPPVAAPPVAAPAAVAAPVAPPVGAAPATAATAPKSRGWTMFTEASDEEVAEATALAAAQAPAEAAAAEAGPAAPAFEESAPAAEGKARRGDADAPSKKRGWTMFMEKPLADAPKDPLGGAAPSPGESNAKGWTVFSPAADVNADAAAAAEPTAAAAPTVVVTPPPRERSGPQPVAAARDASPLGPASGQTSALDDDGARAQAAADSERLRAKTLIVTGPPDAAISSRPKTMVTPPGSGPAAAGPVRVITQVTPEQQSAAAAMQAGPPSGSMHGFGGPPSGPMSAGISGPISTGMTGPISTGMPVQTGAHALVPAKRGSPVALIVVGVVIAAGAIVGAIVMLT